MKAGEVIKSLVTLCMLPISILAGGWALSLEWGWFIVPTFNAHPITIGQGCGIMSAAGVPLLGFGAVSSIRRQIDKGKLDEENEGLALVFGMIAMYAWSTGMAWILYSVLAVL